jgi:hypothetical protein
MGKKITANRVEGSKPPAGSVAHGRVWLLAIVIFALLLRLYFYVGPNLNDDVDYCWSAHEVSLGNFGPLFGGSINAIRSMMTMPVAFFFSAFGAGEFQASMWPLLCSLLTIVATYFLGKLLFNERVGLIGAALLSFFPLDVAFSTQLVPTTPVVMFASCALVLFIKAEKIGDKKESRSTRLVLLLLSGILFGFTHLASETGVIVTMFTAVAYVVVNRKIKLDYSLVVLGFVLVVAIETAMMFAATGDPLHRLKVIHDTEVMIGTNTDMAYYPRVLLRLLRPDYNSHEGNMGIIFFLFLGGSLYAIVKKDKNALFLFLSFVLIMGYFEYGVMTLGMKPIAKWVRYILVFGPTFCLVGANLIDKINLGRLARFGFVARNKEALAWLVKIAALVAIFAINWQYISGAVGTYRQWTADFHAEWDYLKTLSPKPIYTDQGSLGFLGIYYGWKKPITGIEGANLSDIHDAYVLVNASHGAVEYAPMRDALPYNHEPIPNDWVLLMTLITSNIMPKVYLAPEVAAISNSATNIPMP